MSIGEAKKVVHKKENEEKSKSADGFCQRFYSKRDVRVKVYFRSLQ